MTATNTPTAPAAPAWVVISEVAWAGTAASSTDEWIELWNPGAADVDLTGWVLTDGGDIHADLGGTIGAGGFYLLERTRRYHRQRHRGRPDLHGGAFEFRRVALPVRSVGEDRGFRQRRRGSVAGGEAASSAAMERTGDGPASDSSWCTNDGVHRSGSDAGGNPINGTPRQSFSGFCAAPTPSRTPDRTSTTPRRHHRHRNRHGDRNADDIPPTAARYDPQSVIISEVAWAGTAASSSDEWIELWNPGSARDRSFRLDADRRRRHPYRARRIDRSRTDFFSSSAPTTAR